MLSQDTASLVVGGIKLQGTLNPSQPFVLLAITQEDHPNLNA
jgi:hypothetical protein